jgi:2-polyprenyl-3-methyl-5-hydroxy-6-metoxy-1,4-benzoquinol methylase
MKRYKLKFIANIINGIDGHSILDIGCRDCYLNELLTQDLEYLGCDIFQNQKGSVDVVGDFQDIHFTEQYDFVTALDVVEHVDDPFALTEKIFKTSKKYVIITLPNIFNYSKKFDFLFNNSLGGKYDFYTENKLDRHRWIMNYEQIVRFYKHIALKYDTKLTIHNLKMGFDNSNKLKKLILHAINLFLGKKNSAKTLVGVFCKK